MKIARIYIPLWLDLLSLETKNKELMDMYLHSTMVRFIIELEKLNGKMKERFTFHYG
mgnify:CR=1 FL=1